MAVPLPSAPSQLPACSSCGWVHASVCSAPVLLGSWGGRELPFVPLASGCERLAMETNLINSLIQALVYSGRTNSTPPTTVSHHVLKWHMQNTIWNNNHFLCFPALSCFNCYIFISFKNWAHLCLIHRKSPLLPKRFGYCGPHPRTFTQLASLHLLC